MNKKEHNLAYKLVTFSFKILFKIFFRVKIDGINNFPSQGGFIISSNHISYWDPPLVGTILTSRKVHFMAKAELFDMFILKNVLPKLGAFPVKRDTVDRKAIKRALEILEGGGVVGLFPEGTRSKTGELQKPLNGPALLAVKTNSPIVPVAITGPYKLFGKVRVRVGKPIEFKDMEGQKIRGKQLTELSEKIMQEIALLLWNND